MNPVLPTADRRGILAGMELPGQPDLPAGRSSVSGAASGAWNDRLETTACEASACTLKLAAVSDPLLPEAQRRWAARPLTERLQPLRAARHWIAAHPGVFAGAISAELARSQADTLLAEVLPLLEAMRFLERNAARILAPKKLGGAGRPLWLTGVQAEVHRDPLGHILVIGPANFPLFLAGAQTLQALVAGNAVTWKPGAGGGKVARLLAHVLRESGLPRGILRITDESVEAAQAALAQHPDKVVFTGSFETGRKILGTLASSATPATMELSGADAVVVLPSADLPLVAKAVAFGLRLNGGEVCMSPRRLVATRETLNALRPLLQAELANVPPVQLKESTAKTLGALLEKSKAQGATVLTPAGSNPFLASAPRETEAPRSGRSAEDGPRELRRPVLLDHATPHTAVARADIFAPVLSLIEAPSVLHLADMVNDNPYGLTAAIFGNPREAQTLAAQLRVGTVVINDLIAPTADPRVPFGGRGHSGFGTTRGAEGLLEMTAAKAVLTRRKGSTRHYDPLGPRALPVSAAVIGVLHGGGFGQRWQALKHLITAARERTGP